MYGLNTVSLKLKFDTFNLCLSWVLNSIKLVMGYSYIYRQLILFVSLANSSVHSYVHEPLRGLSINQSRNM